MKSLLKYWPIIVFAIGSIGAAFTIKNTVETHDKTIDEMHETQVSIDRRLSRIEGALGVHEGEVDE